MRDTLTNEIVPKGILLMGSLAAAEPRGESHRVRVQYPLYSHRHGRDLLRQTWQAEGAFVEACA